jgi:transketolase
LCYNTLVIAKGAKLNEELFRADVRKVPIRDGFGEGLREAAAKNPNVVALSADLSESTRTEAFAKLYPERFMQVGVAEQNMAGIAAGLGISGKIPFIASFATFSPGRNWEQIRTTIAYNNSNVKIAGHHAGVSTGPDGATHQALEDIALMRALPNMKVIVPCDAEEARKATVAATKLWGPIYLRLARSASPIITTAKTPFVPGKGLILWDSTNPAKRGGKKRNVAIFACGPLVANALHAARELAEDDIGAVVANIHTIKPLDEPLVVELAKRTGAVVTVEEHQVAGGLGGAVAEALAKKAPTPQEFIGMHDRFGESGAPEELVARFGMGVEDIVRAARRAVRRS